MNPPACAGRRHGDLAGELDGPVFALLRDPAYFARFTVDDTLVWPNGADFAPEFLRERLRGSNRAPDAGRSAND